MHPSPSFFDRGDAFYSSFETHLLAAREEILMNVYAFHNDRVGRRFLSLLEKKAREGVRVRVIFDAVGSWGDQEEVVREIEHAGGEARIFRSRRSYFHLHPVSFLYRDHARLFLVDRRIFGLGGMGIGEVYRERDDFFILLTVARADELVRLFDRLWYLGNYPGSLDDRAGQFEDFEIGEGMRALVSGPKRAEQRIHAWLLRALSGAKERVLIVTAWFFPTRAVFEELARARRRGAHVTVLTPLATDRRRYDAIRALPLPPLMKEGVEWYGIPAYFHQKFFVVDGEWCFGSANFDIISLRRNYELNVCGADPHVRAALEGNARTLIGAHRPLASHPAPYLAKRLWRPLYGFLEFVFTASA